VVVFLDYQNVFMGARRAFAGLVPGPTDGQVDPLRLARWLVADSPYDRTLTQVRVYRGRPDSSRDPQGYGANLRQCTAWEELGAKVTTRTLRYPNGWPTEKAQEKGIDVQVAVDFVMMALRKEYDVGILMSTDTDLKPALEAVVDLGGNRSPRCEVAAWEPPEGHARRLSIDRQNLWCHWLSASAYRAVADPADYR
jgi:hypothetical protein